jgi:uncharacterized membrane protein
MSVRLDQRQRLLVAAPLGLAAGGSAASFAPWQLSVLAGWDVAALFIAGSAWMFIAVLDASATRAVATREDDSRAVVDFIVVAACVVSLVGVVVGLAHARSPSATFSSLLTTIAVGTVFLSWFTVHTLFTLRYAHLYYRDPVGGIDFGGADEVRDPPDYMDFVYVAFTVGMTFQVSDTNIFGRPIRRAIVRHSLLSYLFGTVVVGVAINVVGNLIR